MLPVAPTSDAAARVVLPGKWERLAFYVIWCLSGLWQWHAAVHDGAMGQDFSHNYGACILTSQNFSLAWMLAKTNPPGFHLLAASIIRWTGASWGVVVIGLVNTAFSLAALAVFYRLSLRLIVQPVFRLGLLTLVAFVPVRLIHGVVIASDALTLLPFFLLALTLIRLAEERNARRRGWLSGGVCLLLLLGMFIKYTFMSSLVAVVVVLAQGVRRGRMRAREAVRLGLLCTVPPLFLLVAQMQTQTDFQTNFGMHGDPVDNMSYGTVFGLRRADPHVLDAPEYDEPNLEPDQIPIFQSPDNDRDTRYEMMIANRYSYLALLHWSTFTDPLNIFQPRRGDRELGERSARNQRLMTLAVRTALPITLAIVLSVALLALSAGWGGLVSPMRTSAGVEVVLLLGLGWFANIALLMPHVHGAVLGGYWTPRLVLPGLLMFTLLTFHVLDTRFQGRAGRLVGSVVLGFVVCQSALHAAFLWI